VAALQRVEKISVWGVRTRYRKPERPFEVPKVNVTLRTEVFFVGAYYVTRGTFHVHQVVGKQRGPIQQSGADLVGRREHRKRRDSGCFRAESEGAEREEFETSVLKCFLLVGGEITLGPNY
jgi:hypothetical protein